MTDLGTDRGDCDEVYVDFTSSGTPATSTDQLEPGLWRKIGSMVIPIHNDPFGTLRRAQKKRANQAIQGEVFVKPPAHGS